MGKGNYITGKENSGQYYVDNEFFEQSCRPTPENREDSWEISPRKDISDEDYSKEAWEYDECGTSLFFDEFKSDLAYTFVERYPSFVACNEWPDRETHAIAENSLFYLTIADNESSTAIAIYAKDLDDNMVGLQQRHYQGYLESLKNILLDIFGEVSFRTGAWTSGTIRKENVA